MDGKVRCVYDEGAVENTPLIGAKGIGLLVEADGQKTLFDTGMRGRYLLHNLMNMGVKANDIDRVVISHNHKSNIGGISKLLEYRKEPLDIYVNESYGSVKGMFGKPLVGPELSKKANYHIMSGNTEISKNLTMIGPFGPEEEFFLLINTIKGPVVLSSCYHCGTKAVLGSVKSITKKDPICLIGGIHVPKANQKAMDPTAEIFRSFGTPDLYLNHCADPKGKLYLRTHFGLDFVHDFYVGSEYEFKTTE